jgi:DNA topoisomerase-1
MSKQYCFKINNPNDVDFDQQDLKKHITSFYVGTSKDKFTKEEIRKILVVIYIDIDNDICILLRTRGQKNIERIENINKKIPTRKLKWKGITLVKPELWDVEQQTWWSTEEDNKSGKLWSSLSQRGPYFTHLEEGPYESLGGKLMYNGTSVPLSAKEEQVAMLYAKRLVSENSGGVVDKLTIDPVFNQNFWNDFKTYLTPAHRETFKDFNKISWKDLQNKVEKIKEHKPTNEEKRNKLIRNEEKKRKYGYATLDGSREKVGNFTVEPVGLFMGRGKHPKRGKIKKEVNPEDVTINIDIEASIPVPPAGHSWGKVVHDRQATWLAKWKDSITGGPKYVRFDATGKFKGESDLAKYEKARKLQMHINTVRRVYMSDAASTNDEKMQLGTVLWLIDHHGIRPGDERSEDQADTVGATTLRVDHVKLLKGDTIKFEFLGKDSIKFDKKMEVPTVIYENFRRLVAGRKKEDQVFNKISAGSINNYLKQFDVNFSNKVFRTRLASYIMFDALKNVSIPKSTTKNRTKFLFNKANVKVAEILNHTRSISMKAKAAIKKLKESLKELRAKLKLAKSEKKSDTTIKSLKRRIVAKRESIDAKNDTMAVAISTSLTNYIDPRIVVSWAKKQAAKSKKSDVTERATKILKDVYSKAMWTKFQWAIKAAYVTKDWNWLTSPLIGDPKLIPGKHKPRKRLRKSTDRSKSTSKRLRKSTDRSKSTSKRLRKSTDRSKSTSKRLRKSTDRSKSRKPEPSHVSGKDSKILLELCRDKFRNLRKVKSLRKVNTPNGYRYPALDWLYTFTLYSVEKNKGNILLSERFNKFYQLVTKK